MIYLDYQSTTPLAPEARAAMLPWLEGAANPHSSHKAGRIAAAEIGIARERVAALLPPDGKVYFTSGATEALNWAITSAAASGGGIVTLGTEHAAVLDTLASRAALNTVLVVPVRADGLVDLDAARAAIKPGVSLVCAMHVNNEIGVIQPITELAGMAHAVGARLLCDAVQGFGREPLPEGCDYIAITAHKIYGPIGVGALWVASGAPLSAMLHGGGQEGGLRSGTLSPALCGGFGAAAKLMLDQREADAAHVVMLASQLRAALGADWIVNGSTDQRYAGNLNVRRDGLDAARLISDVREVAFSAGSACASGSGRTSHVLRALGLSTAQARSSIRLGFGRYTTAEDIAEAAALISAAADQQRII